MKKLSILMMVLVMVAGLVSCGGGGGGGDGASQAPVISNSTEGHYVLRKFLVVWKDGSFLDSDNIDSSRFSGTMDIYSNGYVIQSVTFDGYTFKADGWILAMGTDHPSLVAQTGDCQFRIDYWWERPTLTTQVNYPCGASYKEKDVWEKVANKPNPAPNSLLEDEELEGVGCSIGTLY